MIKGKKHMKINIEQDIYIAQLDSKALEAMQRPADMYIPISNWQG